MFHHEDKLKSACSKETGKFYKILVIPKNMFSSVFSTKTKKVSAGCLGS